jgi:isovaleryl-CoA dehydrogenase
LSTPLELTDARLALQVAQTNRASAARDLQIARARVALLPDLPVGPLGIMQACMDVVVPYVHERKQFDTPIGEFQLMQGKLADMYTTMNACRAYVYFAARAADRGVTTRYDAAGCLLYAAEKATAIALQAIQTLGGNGYINDYPTGRLLRDAELYEIGAGTSEIRRMLIGRELFEATA